MSREIKCTHCHEDFILKDDECQNANCCDECFEMMQQQYEEPEIDEFSDADPGR